METTNKKTDRNFLKIGDTVLMNNGNVIQVKSLCYNHIYCEPNGMVNKKDVDSIITTNF
jgi:hypothetical protein|tara:strand:+ start:96011 stop:96187 length:177 start_codon:yes stop_codon:yes gene_type:complete